MKTETAIYKFLEKENRSFLKLIQKQEGRISTKNNSVAGLVL